MNRKELIEQKKKQLYFKNLMKSIDVVTTKEIYEIGTERDYYKDIIYSYHKLWQDGGIKPYSKLTCKATDKQCCNWIIDQAELKCDKEYIFIKVGYYEGYAKIIFNNLYEAVLELWNHELKLHDLYCSVNYGFCKGFCLIDLSDKKIIDVALVSDDEDNYQLWQWYY